MIEIAVMVKNYLVLQRDQISPKKFRKLFKYFVLDIEAAKTAYLSGFNRNVVDEYLLFISKIIS